ncbi:hypothetical protein, partial [Escherichia coli]|uniref:hypothetical protein n=1 Tax=Escherichia coli TaxID=562 RepID=UPI001FB53E5F
FRQSCNSILRCPSISDGRLSYQFSSDGYIRRSVYAYDAKIFKESSFNENCSAITGGRSAIYECICNDSGADVDIPGSDNTGTENINYGVDSKKTIFRRDGFRPET